MAEAERTPSIDPGRRGRLRGPGLRGRRGAQCRVERQGDLCAEGQGWVAGHPNLAERYDQADYLIEHRGQIKSAVDYLHNHAPGSDQLASAAQQSARTLERLSTSYDRSDPSAESLTATGPTNFWQTLPEVKDHISAAWTAWPDLDSIERLRKVSDDVVPFLDQVNAMDIDFPRIYSAVLGVADNFASDEDRGHPDRDGDGSASRLRRRSRRGLLGASGQAGSAGDQIARAGREDLPPLVCCEPRVRAIPPRRPRARIAREIVADPEKALAGDDVDALQRYFDDRREATGRQLRLTRCARSCRCSCPGEGSRSVSAQCPSQVDADRPRSGSTSVASWDRSVPEAEAPDRNHWSATLRTHADDGPAQIAACSRSWRPGRHQLVGQQTGHPTRHDVRDAGRISRRRSFGGTKGAATMN